MLVQMAALWQMFPRVHAHPAAAAPPEFPVSDCVTTLDRAQYDTFALSYVVPTDDTVLTEGDIPLRDAKSHQFFAFRGQVAALGSSHVYRPFAPDAVSVAPLPLWITEGDVQRAAAASAQLLGIATAAELPLDQMLETHAALADQWLRMTPDDGRLPILARQTLVPVRWGLSDVPAGVYTVAGYIFSPPYNGWAVRPGVLKIKDAQHDPPAGEIAALSETVFSQQGRKLTACLDVPDGSTLDGDYRVEEQPERGWQSWLRGRPIRSGELSLCFHTSRRDVSGNLRLRLTLLAPDGSRTALHSHDTITWLQGQGPCLESRTQCCAFDEAPAPALSGVADEVVDIAPPAAAHCSASLPGRAPFNPRTLLAALALLALLRARGATAEVKGCSAARARRHAAAATGHRDPAAAGWPGCAARPRRAARRARPAK